MEILNIILGLIVAFLGLPVGFVLARLTKEELKPGIKYFQVMQSTILALAIIIGLYFNTKNIILLAIVAVITIVLSIKLNPKAIISYIILLSIFLLGTKNINLFLIITSLIFLYGFPTAALISAQGLKKYMKDEIENPIETGYLAKTNQKIKYVSWVFMLEFITIPTLIMKKKSSALYHLKFICPICPSSRRKHRDIHGKSTCWWEYNWLKKNYNIPKHFGMINWIKQYTKFGTNLKKFRNVK